MLKVLQDAEVSLIGNFSGTALTIPYGCKITTDFNPTNWVLVISSVVLLDSQEKSLNETDSVLQTLSEPILLSPSDFVFSLPMTLQISVRFAGMAKDDRAALY